jgi:hypothetical protein
MLCVFYEMLTFGGQQQLYPSDMVRVMPVNVPVQAYKGTKDS